MKKTNNQTANKEKLNNFKNEIASELGVNLKDTNITAKEAGKVGGEMVRRMVSKFENK